MQATQLVAQDRERDHELPHHSDDHEHPVHKSGVERCVGDDGRATTQASSAIGAVTEAQMAKIFFSEYCLELAGASTGAGSDCVFVMSLSVGGERGSRTSSAGLEIAASSTPHG